MFKYHSVILLIVLCTVSCTPSYTREKTQDILQDTRAVENHRIRRENNWVLPQNAKLYLAYPAIQQVTDDQRLNRTQYRIAVSLHHNFLRYFPTLQISLDEQALEASFREAQRNNQDFLVYPNLLNISRNPLAGNAERDTDKSTKNTLELNLQIYDVASRKLVDTIRVSSKQGWLDFGTHEPTDLLDKAMDAAAKALSGS